MKFCNRWLAVLWFGLLGTALASSALAQVTTRLTVPGGAATSTKILPGSPVSFDIRVDATVGTIGTAYFLRQSAPSGAGAFFPFQLTGRDLTGSPYNDAGSFLPDGTILATPSALLAPVTASNLGSSLLAGTPAAANIMVATITLSSNPASPLGVYTVRPDPTNAWVTDTSFIDHDMSGAAFNITIGQQLSVVLAGSGTGTVTANSGAINCPVTCSDIYPGTAVTLTPANGTGTFAGWSGACSGTGSCVVTVDAAKSVTATFNLPTFALTVSKAGTGTGLVTSNPAGINCGATCSASYTSGTVVTLTAAPTAPATFAGWSGACSGTGSCVVTVDAAKSVTATFDLPTFALTVSKAGTGAGLVTSNPAGINCGATCTASYTSGTVVTLTAAPTAPATFTGWTGACSGTGTCVVTVDAAKSVTATFDLPSFALTVSKAGTGTGLVTSNPAGINCGATCTASYTSGTVVTLTAAPTAPATFAGWSGACSGTGSCVVTVDAAKSVTATFNLPTFALTVSKAGTGTGLVTSNPAGINCGATCSASYTSGTVVTLTAAPTAPATFAGWSGACSGTGSCVVTVDAAKSVTATFDLPTFALTVSKAGTGAGLVTSNPAGINCGATCTASYTSGTVVTLTAAPTAPATFAGWSGACSGTGSCVVTVDAAKSVTATFNLPTFALTVSKAGTGAGLVTSNPAGINCGATCSASYTSGTVVTLTAAPTAPATFAGWSGACSGTGSCVVTVDAAKSVTATFTLPSFVLSVTSAGNGAGLVTSNPAGINCGATCSASYASGTVVTLTATPTAPSVFAGWGGACSGSGSCVVTVDAAKSVTATFNTIPTLVSAVSRKVHGVAGTFDLPLSSTTTSPTTEPRAGPYVIVFTFDRPVIAGSASVTEGVATAGTPTFNGNEMTVPLTAVTNAQYVTVAAANVVPGGGGSNGSGAVRVGFLFGDVNQSGQVLVSDVGAVNGKLLQSVSGANFLFDVNADGRLTVSDVGLTNANLLKKLPAP